MPRITKNVGSAKSIKHAILRGLRESGIRENVQETASHIEIWIMEYIRNNAGTFILSSEKKTEALNKLYPEIKKFLKALGINLKEK